MSVAAPVAPQLSARLGTRSVVRIGLAAEVVGILGIALSVGVDVSVWRFVPSLFVYGMGVGFATAQLTGIILADVPVAKSGQASGTQSTARQVGSAFGVAIIGAVLVTTLSSSATGRLADAGVPAAQASGLVSAATSSAGAAIGTLRAEQGADAPAVVALEKAYVEATRQVGLVASGLVLLGLFASFSLGSGRTADHIERS